MQEETSSTRYLTADNTPDSLKSPDADTGQVRTAVAMGGLLFGLFCLYEVRRAAGERFDPTRHLTPRDVT